VIRLIRLTVLAAGAAVLLLVLPGVGRADPTRITARDDCDATTFNLAVPADPPTCVGNGGTTFADFLGQLADHRFVGSWNFSPKQVKLDVGDPLVVTNRGGETHTFTQTTRFGGGGVVPPLNIIMFGTPTPPTFFFGPPNSIPAGGTFNVPSSMLTPGTHLFMCIIHPWMEETVVVR
jgi:plastocyanin